MRTERRRGRSAALLVAATLLDVASSTGAAMAADAGGTAAGRDRAALTTAIASFVVAVVAALFAMARDRRAQKVEQSLASQQEKLHRDLAAQAKASQRELEMLKAQLTASAKAEERALDAKTQLDRHREPLLLAVLDLTHRIDNIRNQGFLGYLRHEDGHRADVARLGTFYRFARYWAVAQWLYEEVNLLRFERESETRAVAEALGRVGSLFASDTLDSGRLMVWREEQRAIAELMLARQPTRVIGFATFTQRYDADFAQWFLSFDTHLRAIVTGSKRLELLQVALAHLAQLLDTERTFESQWRRFLAPTGTAQ